MLNVKKLLSAMIAVVMALSLAACGPSKEEAAYKEAEKQANEILNNLGLSTSKPETTKSATSAPKPTPTPAPTPTPEVLKESLWGVYYSSDLRDSITVQESVIIDSETSYPIYSKTNDIGEKVYNIDTRYESIYFILWLSPNNSKKILPKQHETGIITSKNGVI